MHYANRVLIARRVAHMVFDESGVIVYSNNVCVLER